MLRLLSLIAPGLIWALVFLMTTSVMAAEREECAKCHSHRFKLDDLTTPLIIAQQKEQGRKFFQEGAGYQGLQPPKDLFQKMFISKEFFKTPHGRISCSKCHQGDPEATDTENAHQGMITDPTLNRALEICGDCHQSISRRSEKISHAAGVESISDLKARCSGEQWQQLQGEALGEQCSSCHFSSCGSCHVSYPDISGSGLINNHLFKGPDPIYQCASCHNTPIFKDFIGKFGRGDAHYRDQEMTCISCHRGTEMHAAANERGNRYQHSKLPACLDCHQKLKDRDDCGFKQHKGRVACNVCHSQSYQNCSSCHMVPNDGEGRFRSSPDQLDFRIGFNPGEGENEPAYVLLRRIGVKGDSFKDYLQADLAHFDRRPTFKRTSPHNIQRHTWQNASCNHCHGNKELFLTRENVPAGEQKANRKVMLSAEDIPGRIESAGTPPGAESLNREMRVDAEWLHNNLDQENLLILDVRHGEDYEFEHIPGAVNLCGCYFRTGFETEVPFQMKAPQEIVSLLVQKTGLTNDQKVIIYGGSNRNWPAVAFVALEMIGHRKVAFLDGNFNSWLKAGYETEWGMDSEVKPGSYELKPRDVLIDSKTIKEERDKLIVLDGRVLSQYTGDIARTAISDKGGHIPGALSLPAASLFKADGTFKSPEQLQWLFGLYGISGENERTVVATCNTNSLASNIYMILRYLGHDNVKLHNGAWSEWVRMNK